MRPFVGSIKSQNLKEILAFLPAFDLEAKASDLGYTLRRRKLSLSEQLALWLVAIWEGSGDSLATMMMKHNQNKEESFRASEQAFSYVNCTRGWELFRDLFRLLVEKADRRLRRHIKGLPIKLLDGSVVKGLAPKVARFFSLAGKGGAVLARLKTHVLLDPATGPRAVKITDANNNDGQHTDFIWEDVRRNTLVIFDLGYWNFGFLDAIHEREAFFVTRVSPRNRPKLVKWLRRTKEIRDYVARLDRHKSHPKRCRVRVIEQRQEDGTWWRWCTNLMDPKRFPAEEIIELYRMRWQVEVFFRQLKHVFHLKRVRSMNPNALLVELYVSFIAYLLAHWIMSEAARQYPPPEGSQYCLVRTARLLYALLEKRILPLPELLELIATYCTIVLSKKRQKPRSLAMMA